MQDQSCTFWLSSNPPRCSDWGAFKLSPFAKSRVNPAYPPPPNNLHPLSLRPSLPHHGTTSNHMTLSVNKKKDCARMRITGTSVIAQQPPLEGTRRASLLSSLPLRRSVYKSIARSVVRVGVAVEMSRRGGGGRGGDRRRVGAVPFS